MCKPSETVVYILKWFQALKEYDKKDQMLFTMRGDPAYFSDVDFLQTVNCDKGFYVLLNKNRKCGFC